MNRRDPRIRQTLDRITTTLESANTATQTSFYDFSSQYLNPCLSSLSQCLSESCAPCVNLTRDRARARQRALLRSQRPEAVFDFYADWDDDPYEYEGDISGGEGSGGSREGRGGGGGAGGVAANERTGLLSGWGVDELDRLLAGRPKEDQQPTRQGGMTYGTARRGTRRGSGKGPAAAKGELDDPNVVPASSKFGFLERLPFKFGPRGLRYKPSAANMQEGLLQRRPNLEGGAGADNDNDDSARERRRNRTEGERLLDDVDGHDDDDDDDDEYYEGRSRRRRERSGTMGSGHTDTSYSSRGDLFPSDEEDDAVMIDDDMALALGRRHTADSGGSSNKSGRRESGAGGGSGSGSGRRKRPSSSRKSTSSKSQDTNKSPGAATTMSKGKSFSGDSLASPTILESPEALQLPSMDDLRREEDQVRRDEEAEVARKREEAQQLAVARGLVSQEEPQTSHRDDGQENATTSDRQNPDEGDLDER